MAKGDFPLTNARVSRQGLTFLPAFGNASSDASTALAGYFFGEGSTYTLTLDVGSFAFTGQVVGIERSLRLAADVESFAFTGQAVGLLRALRLGADAGAFAFTGQAVNLVYSGSPSSGSSLGGLNMAIRLGL